MSLFNETMIAPCGMNCGICRGHLREKKKCLGCNDPDVNKPNYCLVCRIKHCEEMRLNQSNYCFACEKFPCARLKQLDKRYRTKYGMSMIENLNKIKETGIVEFLNAENQKWVCGPMRRGIMCPSGHMSQLRPKESILSNKFPPDDLIERLFGGEYLENDICHLLFYLRLQISFVFITDVILKQIEESSNLKETEG
jgi:hypothetical protein